MVLKVVDGFWLVFEVEDVFCVLVVDEIVLGIVIVDNVGDANLVVVKLIADMVIELEGFFGFVTVCKVTVVGIAELAIFVGFVTGFNVVKLT